MQSLADSEGPSSDLSGKPPPADKSIRRAESLRRDSPLQPIVLARQALQVCCACVHVCTCVCLQTFTARVVQGAGQAGLQGSVRAHKQATSAGFTLGIPLCFLAGPASAQRCGFMGILGMLSCKGIHSAKSAG